QGLDWDLWVIPKGDPRLDDAYKFIAFASAPAQMADRTHYSSYGPANKDAIPLVDPEILPHLPTATENMKNALLTDPTFWGDKGEELRQRFTACLAQWRRSGAGGEQPPAPARLRAESRTEGHDQRH